MNTALCAYLVSNSRGTRHLRAVRRLGELGLPIVHIPAVFLDDDRHNSYDHSGRLRRRGLGMTKGEIGCFLAHRNAWKIISEQEENLVALVVEDDVGFHPGVAGVIADAAANLGSGDFIRVYSDWERRTLRSITLEGGYRMGIPCSPGNTTVAYMIRSPAARRLLSGSVRFNRPVDDYLGHAWLHGCREVALSPSPCIHDHGGSSVIGRREHASGFRPWVHRMAESALKRLVLVDSFMRGAPRR